MINRETLSAKSESAQVRYMREAEALQRARKVEIMRSREVARSEAALWRELSRSQGGGERPLSAHRVLTEARRHHAEARGELQVRSRAMQLAESARDYSREMLDALRRRELLVKEGRRGDEGLELALVARAHEARSRCSFDPGEGTSSAISGDGDAPAGCLGLDGAGKLTLGDQVRELGGVTTSPETEVASGRLAHVAVSSGPESATLTVLCSGGAGRSGVGLRLTQAEGKAVSVVVRSVEADSLSVMLRERTSIVQSLRDAGIVVEDVSFERGELEGAESNTGGTTIKRRHRPRRDDEARVA